VSNAVLKEIALPFDTRFSGQKSFPMANRCSEIDIYREAHDCMQVVRHKHQQAHIPCMRILTVEH